MNFKPSIIFLVVGILSVFASQPEFNTNFQELLARADATGCFNRYYDCTENLNYEYQRQYQICEEVANKKRENIETDNENKNYYLARDADNSCQAVQGCNEDWSVEKNFECFTVKAANASSTFDNIQLKASEDLIAYHEHLRIVENEQYTCGNKSSVNYIDGMKEANTLLDRCMNGETVVFPSVRNLQKMMPLLTLKH